MLRRAYIAINIDLVGSRKLEAGARADLQVRLVRFLDAGRARYPLSAQPSISRGDEMQFLVQSPRVALDICWAALFDLHPVAVRCGVGVGALATGVSDAAPVTTDMLDGPCFHAARQAINDAKAHDSWMWSGYAGPRRRGLNSAFMCRSFNQIGLLQTAVIAHQLGPGMAERIAILRRFWHGEQVTKIADSDGRNKSTVSTLLRRSSGRVLKSSTGRQAVYLRALMRSAGGF